jgi:uncharacterized DUF497 family protein
MDILKKLQECTGFNWDKYNIQKSWEKHKISPVESEQVFFNQPLIVVEDIKHSQKEERFYVLGRTDKDRRLFIAFTIRKKQIRIISSRDMNKKEREIYEKYKEERNSKI